MVNLLSSHIFALFPLTVYATYAHIEDVKLKGNTQTQRLGSNPQMTSAKTVASFSVGEQKPYLLVFLWWCERIAPFFNRNGRVFTRTRVKPDEHRQSNVMRLTFCAVWQGWLIDYKLWCYFSHRSKGKWSLKKTCIGSRRWNDQIYVSKQQVKYYTNIVASRFSIDQFITAVRNSHSFHRHTFEASIISWPTMRTFAKRRRKLAWTRGSGHSSFLITSKHWLSWVKTSTTEVENSACSDDFWKPSRWSRS